MSGPFNYCAPILAKNGYQVLPVNGKRPFLESWQSYEFVFGDENRYGACNVGILTESTPAIDVDVSRSDLANELRQLAEDTINFAPVRVGNSPRLAMLYRAYSPFPKL